MLFDDVKLALRITEDAFDSEIVDLIEASKKDLQSVGVAQQHLNDEEPLVKRAIITYCKAFFGWDNPDADRFAQSYTIQKENLIRKEFYSQ